MIRRHLLAVGAVGLGANLTHRSPLVRAQTPSPGLVDADGIEIDFVADSVPFNSLPKITRVGVQRISFAPGGYLEGTYLGPVVFIVERGTLTVLRSTEMMTVTRGGSSIGGRVRRGSRSSSATGAPLTVAAGEVLSVADGNLGRVDNPGTEETIILAVLIIDEATNRAGMESTGSSEVAQPDPTRAP